MATVLNVELFFEPSLSNLIFVFSFVNGQLEDRNTLFGIVFGYIVAPLRRYPNEYYRFLDFRIFLIL
jgi:hypothetical protein